MSLFDQIFNLLTNPPGNLVYHLVLAYSITGALQGAINLWRSTEFPQARRMIIGLVILLTAQMALFVASLLVWQGFIQAGTIIPPLDRAVLLFSLVWIMWLWAFPEPSRMGDGATVLFNLSIGLALALSIVSRMGHDPSVLYNGTTQNLAWSLLTLAFLALAVGVLIVRQPDGWTNGLTLLALAFLGHLVDVIYPLAGNFSGIVRLVNMAAYPILLTLPQRFPMPGGAPVQQAMLPVPAEAPAPKDKEKKQRGKANEDAAQEKPFRERRRYSTEPKTLYALLQLAAETDPEKINSHITHAVAQAMLADLCFLLYLTEDKKQLAIGAGYDLIREEALPGGIIDKESIPLLANALQKGKPLRLPASSTSADLKGLGDLLGLSNPGNLLTVPITADKGPMGGVLLLSPYSNRLWSADDQSFLANISSTFVPIIERGRKITEIQYTKERAETYVNEALSNIKRLEGENEELQNQLEEVRSQASSMARSSSAQDELQYRISQLERENQELKSAASVSLSSTMAALGSEDGRLEQELRMALQETARLQNQLGQANAKILELEKRPGSSSGAGGAISNEQVEVIASISQELRQPMSSIVGYADLLLGESVGILGALQRKFIERIKASTERIGSLIDDLIQITTLETGLMELKPEAIDLNQIIDNAMAYTSGQLREKNITLRIDLPKTLTPVYADREALQQILIHLLQNAGAATPVEGTVTLRVRTQAEGSEDFVLIQISDTGGGIPAEDIPRVFSRLYRADNVLIQGVGDTGVGLSIAKSLTEAQHGRIWVDTELGTGSTFSVLLPINQNVASPAKET
jgi:signal transduction histidine kinase